MGFAEIDVAQPIHELTLSLFSMLSLLPSAVERPGFLGSNSPVEFPTFKINSTLELTWNLGKCFSSGIQLYAQKYQVMKRLTYCFCLGVEVSRLPIHDC
jgi:hypothetical protein